MFKADPEWINGLRKTLPVTDLPASRELDALVAEKIFGFVHDFAECAWCQNDRAGGWARGNPHYPRYSADIAAACQIVERLIDRFAFELIYQRTQPTIWQARFLEERSDSFFSACWFGEADTPALAICRGALEAIELADPPQTSV